MTLIEKVVSAVKPTRTAEERQSARAGAQSAAGLGDWLSMVLEHHRDIESAFTVLEAAGTVSARIRAQRRLGALLIGHANAEETVLYPALAGADEKGHATRAFAEQAEVRTRMALLESIPAMSRAYLDELACIREAVARHMYEEESTWFLELKEKVPGVDQIRLSQRYEQEFQRYIGESAARSPGPAGRASERPLVHWPLVHSARRDS